MQTTNLVGCIVTVAGLLGILISFIIQSSDFDPTSFALSIVSIFIAIGGITLILQPTRTQNRKARRKR